MAPSGSVELRAVLGQVWQSALPRCERRHICFQLAADGVFGHAVGPSAYHGDASINFFTEVMDMAKRYVGVNATISEVKAELRRSGHAPLAGRLSKLSKRRNLAAHPDLSLAADISSALSQPSVPGSVSGMSDADDKSTGDHSTSNKIQVYNDDELECIKRNMKLAQVPAKSVKLQSEGALLQFNFDKQEAGLILGDKELTRFVDAIKQLDTKIDLLSAQSAHLDMEVAALQAKFAEQEAFL